MVVKKTNSLKNLYPKATPQELDLLEKLLQFNPKNLKNNLIDTHEFIGIDDLADDEDYLAFLDGFLNPGQYLVR